MESIHRLWSNFESGGGGIMRVKRAQGRIAPEEGEGVGGELATKLGSSYLNWPELAVCCYLNWLFVVTLVTWAMHCCVCCVRVITFPLQTRVCSSK